MAILYIHGYNGARVSERTLALEEATGLDVIGLTYDASDPKTSLRDLYVEYDTISAAYGNEEMIIFGTSLGGWYATILAAVKQCKLVLHNPSLEPAITLPSLDMEMFGVYDNIINIRDILDIISLNGYGISCHLTDDPVINPDAAVDMLDNRFQLIHYNIVGHKLTEEMIIDMSQYIVWYSNQFFEED